MSAAEDFRKCLVIKMENFMFPLDIAVLPVSEASAPAVAAFDALFSGPNFTVSTRTLLEIKSAGSQHYFTGKYVETEVCTVFTPYNAGNEGVLPVVRFERLATPITVPNDAVSNAAFHEHFTDVIATAVALAVRQSVPSTWEV